MKRTPRAPSSTVGNCPSSAPSSRPACARADRLEDAEVDVREGLEVALGVTRRDARRLLCRLGEVVVPAAQRAHRAARRRVLEQVRILLAPRDRSLAAVHPDADVVLVADLDLRGDEQAAHAALEPQQHRGVVVEQAPGHDRRDVGRDVRDVPARDRGGEVLGVRADVPHRPCDARARRVGAPLGLLVAARLEAGREPPLAVLHDDLAQLAELAVRDHVARVPHERVARVVVGHAEDGALAAHELDQLARLRRGVHERLVADHVEARLDRGLGDRVVHVVRRHDDDEIDAVVRRARELAVEQLLPGAVGPVVGDAEIPRRVPRARRIRGERARGQHRLLVERGGGAVDGSDERVAAAADHAVAERPRASGLTARPCRRRRRTRRSRGRSRGA